jgi:hypothetical protein
VKANKVTVTIVMEALSIDCLGGLVARAVEQIEREYPNGELAAEDGDHIRWSTKTEPVSF